MIEGTHMNVYYMYYIILIKTTHLRYLFEFIGHFENQGSLNVSKELF